MRLDVRAASRFRQRWPEYLIRVALQIAASLSGSKEMPRLSILIG
jgi:hypothetical protein